MYNAMPGNLKNYINEIITEAVPNKLIEKINTKRGVLSKNMKEKNNLFNEYKSEESKYNENIDNLSKEIRNYN